MVHYRVHKSPPLIPVLRQMHPVHTFYPISIRSILIYSHLYLGLPSGLFPLGFPTKILSAFLISPMRGSTWRTTLILLDLITITFSEADSQVPWSILLRIWCFAVTVCWALAHPPSWGTTLCRLSIHTKVL